MPLALLKLIPFRDYLYAAIAALAVVWFLHHDHVERDIGRTQVTQAVQVASDKLMLVKKAEFDKLTTDHANDVAKVEENYEKVIASNDAAHNTDLQRLRDKAARDRSSRPVLGSAGSGSAPADAGSEGDSGLGEVSAALGQEVVDALRDDDALLLKCYDERDHLTGK